MARPSGKETGSPLLRGWQRMRAMQQAERLRIRNELFQVRGLIPLLMKRRNGGKWSTEERATLLRDLRALSDLSPYLVPLLMPGGMLLLPLLAWWLDLRHKRRKDTDRYPPADF